MKFLFITPLAVSGLFLFASCEQPLDPQPGWDWKLDRNTILQDQQGYAKAMAADMCPTPGDDCYKRPARAATFKNASRSFISFKSYYDANDARSFFTEANRPEWEQLFPNLGYSPEIVDRLRAGLYLTYLTRDSNIVVYTGTRDEPNYIFAVVPNLNVRQE